MNKHLSSTKEKRTIEIEFRGKRFGSEEYIYGYYMKLAHPCNGGLEYRYFIVTGSMKKINNNWVAEVIRVRRETVQQFINRKWERVE